MNKSRKRPPDDPAK